MRKECEMTMEVSEFDRRQERLERIVDDLNNRQGRLEGTMEQIDRRLTSFETRLNWILAIVLTSWITLAGLILFKVN